MQIELTSSQPSTTESSTRRRWTRLVSEIKEATLRDDSGLASKAHVIDESFGGIGLIFEANPNLAIEQEIEISYNGVRLFAVIRHIQPQRDGTCRLGLQWKASNLAHRAEGHVVENENDRFIKLIPSGIYMMWKLFESESWDGLWESTERLKREAAIHGIHDLASPVDQLQDTLDRTEDAREIRQSLDRLIAECIRLTEAVGTVSASG